MKKKRIITASIGPNIGVVELVDQFYNAYNAARTREACQVLARAVAEPGTLIGMSLSGALTPAGLGMSCLIPLIEAGLVDYLVSTGANLYHDLHHALDFPMYASTPFLDDRQLKDDKIIRIYDIVFDADVLFDTDAWVYKVLAEDPVFRTPLSTSEFHWHFGRYANHLEAKLGGEKRSVLAAAYRCGVPIYAPAFGDSTFGLNMAAFHMATGIESPIDVLRDVNESTALVYWAKVTEQARSAVWILGGGVPKNFLLQTEPQLQEILGISEKGHDYFVQVTDARPDTGGLSGATPAEAVSWNKIDPDELDSTVVVYSDSTLFLPIATSYLLAKQGSRPLKRLYDRRDDLMAALRDEYRRAKGLFLSPGSHS
ncbi:MAG TPA: deoxyhypusine synthase [Armatimonadota bacterium]|nr:deoxyhypusine synthase [Armatimonadota bacterium]